MERAAVARKKRHVPPPEPLDSEWTATGEEIHRDAEARLLAKIENARREMLRPDLSLGQRRAQALLALDIDANANPQKPWTERDLAFDYVDLRNGSLAADHPHRGEVNGPMEPWGAVELITKWYGIQSRSSCLRRLQQVRTEARQVLESRVWSSLDERDYVRLLSEGLRDLPCDWGA